MLETRTAQSFLVCPVEDTSSKGIKQCAVDMYDVALRLTTSQDQCSGSSNNTCCFQRLQRPPESGGLVHDIRVICNDVSLCRIATRQKGGASKTHQLNCRKAPVN